MFPGLNPWARAAINDVGVPSRPPETLAAKPVIITVEAPKFPPWIPVAVPACKNASRGAPMWPGSTGGNADLADVRRKNAHTERSAEVSAGEPRCDPGLIERDEMGVRTVSLAVPTPHPSAASRPARRTGCRLSPAQRGTGTAACLNCVELIGGGLYGKMRGSPTVVDWKPVGR